VSFAAVAKACAYREAGEAVRPDQLEHFLQGRNGPSLLQFKTARGVPENLPRPNVSPREVKQRLMQHLGADAPWIGV
jgi:phosphonopyruvate decarboxylase